MRKRPAPLWWLLSNGSGTRGKTKRVDGRVPAAFPARSCGYDTRVPAEGVELEQVPLTSSVGTFAGSVSFEQEVYQSTTSSIEVRIRVPFLL